MTDAKLPALAVVKTIAGTGVGTALIADGVINASTGPIVAGMVTIIGTAAVVVAGQFWAARNKAEAERRAMELKADADVRASLLRDYQARDAANQEEIRGLRNQLIDAITQAAKARNRPDEQPPKV